VRVLQGDLRPGEKLDGEGGFMVWGRGRAPQRVRSELRFWSPVRKGRRPVLEPRIGRALCKRYKVDRFQRGQRQN
jgi:hypothetical protein